MPMPRQSSRAVQDDRTVIAERLMTFARPERWETARVVLRDARIKAQIDETENGTADLAAIWEIPGGNAWRIELSNMPNPHWCLRLILLTVLISLGVKGAEGIAAEWYPEIEPPPPTRRTKHEG